MPAPTPTLLFYDTETTGLKKCFDQVMQYAAIRTDLDFNEIERHEFYVKLNPDIIPSPGAIITHRIPISACLKAKYNEYEAMQKIHELMNEPGTISIGYNTLGFDDELLRFGFYRNLQTPYTHQYANGCSRMDLYPMAAAYHLYKPDVLTWPQIEGKVSLKLEHLSAANALAAGMAHNALVDVEATIELAKRFKKNAEMWKYLTGFFDKATDGERLQKLPRTDYGSHYGILVNGRYGAKRLFQSVCLNLGPHKHYNNQTVWLRLDDVDFATLDKETIHKDVFALFRKRAETYFALPPEERFLQRLSNDRRGLMQKNIDFFGINPEILKQLQRYHCHYTYPEVPGVDVDAALYGQGFPDEATKRMLLQFHRSKPSDKKAIMQQLSVKHYHELAFRLLARNYPELLDDGELNEFTENMSKPMIDYRKQTKLSAEDALKLCDECEQRDLDAEQQTLLSACRAFYSELIHTNPSSPQHLGL